MHQQAQKLNQHNGSNITHLAVDLCRFDCLSVHMEEPLEWRKHPTSALSCRKSPYLHLFVQRTDQEVSNKQSHSTSNYRLPRNSHGFLRGSICHCCVLSRNFSCWWFDSFWESSLTREQYWKVEILKLPLVLSTHCFKTVILPKHCWCHSNDWLMGGITK